ncbi:glycosyltransferase family 2 protein [Mucilaginibacter pallidiroseus]|uniref:Glycosyltransferase family 2 protein n=1 Tax=Mucilaginibacter pallidiroseus TaxID=2599295 RepID=A0A563UG92_9SPHI|nr:glycosyltransferase family 2 protein [Mucilaginibacter pallidiroseus]TWR30367.1 glycosyltransferase family 2 protein [Mucilaginibacter pallidiroseus]
MNSPAPIALFLYNRPDHARETIAYLQKNELAQESPLFIFCDAAKTAVDYQAVAGVKELAKTVTGFKSVEIIERESNLGLANSIISGVSKLISEYGRVIVFEDDLVSSPYALKFFNDALDNYADQEKVMHIGAYMFDLDDKSLPETFFSRVAFSWGWATWARAWQHLETDVDRLMAQFDAQKIHEFSAEGSMNFWKQMQDFKARKNNSWAIRWYASVFLKGGLTLNPSQSLIHNIGHDGSGTHSNIENTYQVQLAVKPVTYFPSQIIESREAFQSIKRFFKNRKGSLLARGVRYLKQTWLKR